MRIVVVSHDEQLLKAVSACLDSDIPCRQQPFEEFLNRHQCDHDAEELSIIDAKGVNEDVLHKLARRCCESDCALLVIIHHKHLIQKLRSAGLRCHGLFDVLFWSDLPSMLNWKLMMYQRIMRSDREFRDVKEAESRLRYSEEALQEIADSMPLLIWRADAEGNLNYYNKRWYEYTGMKADAREFNNWLGAVHPDDVGCTKEAWWYAISTGGEYLVEYRLREHSSGKYYWHLARGVPVRDAQGVITKWFGSCTNIDPLKRSSQEVERLAVQLNHANRLKDEFLATLSHELRTPLNVVLGYAELLASEEALNESEEALNDIDQRTFLAAIIRNAEMLSRLVNDLLDVSKIITGKLSIHVSSVNLCEITSAVAESLHVTWQAKGVNVQIHCPRETPIVKADGDRIRQVVWNLLTNAIKFTPSQGHIEIRVWKEKDFVFIQVKDSGSGIEKEFLPRVFERFSQQDGSAARKYGGLGLGLAIVRHIVELHGGSVSAESEGIGKGGERKLFCVNQRQVSSRVEGSVPRTRF